MTGGRGTCGGGRGGRSQATEGFFPVEPQLVLLLL